LAASSLVTTGRLVTRSSAWRPTGRTGQRDQACLFSCLEANSDFGPLRLSEEQKLDWFATVRGRVGYAADHWLWYVTGGVAFARIDSNHVYTDGAGLLNPQIPTTVVASNASFNRTGIALGAGVETALAGNWTAKLDISTSILAA
jgi:outer membrane immunogenic protein